MKTIKIREDLLRRLVEYTHYFISECEYKLLKLHEDFELDINTDIAEATELLEQVKGETGISENVVTYAQVKKNLE